MWEMGRKKSSGLAGGELVLNLVCSEVLHKALWFVNLILKIFGFATFLNIYLNLQNGEEILNGF
jgi:hypothetical protein